MWLPPMIKLTGILKEGKNADVFVRVDTIQAIHCVDSRTMVVQEGFGHKMLDLPTHTAVCTIGADYRVTESPAAIYMMIESKVKEMREDMKTDDEPWRE